ncbi:MAG: carbohydrate ABC transporter permease [Firmicutes bacterium]|nr:carbohydrate ABC transporter permease [Bacillota bacterium]
MTLSANKKAKATKRARFTAYIAFSSVLAVFFLFPYAVMLSKSLMEGYESVAVPPRFFPTVLNFLGFKNAIDPLFLKYLWNTLYVLVFNMFFGTLSALLCAYSFAKLKWKGRSFVFAVTLATMMMPGIVLQIPLYIMYVKVFRWTDTLAPLTIPSLFGGGALSIFLIRQFMLSFPKELDDAARIDGAGTLTHFFKIIVPLCMPIIVYLVISAFMGVWNDFMGPLIYISNPDKYTIPVGIYFRFTEMDYSGILKANTQMATGVILSVPTAILFIIFQKKLIDGIMIGSIKG